MDIILTDDILLDLGFQQHMPNSIYFYLRIDDTNELHIERYFKDDQLAYRYAIVFKTKGRTWYRELKTRQDVIDLVKGLTGKTLI